MKQKTEQLVSENLTRVWVAGLLMLLLAACNGKNKQATEHNQPTTETAAHNHANELTYTHTLFDGAWEWYVDHGAPHGGEPLELMVHLTHWPNNQPAEAGKLTAAMTEPGDSQLTAVKQRSGIWKVTLPAVPQPPDSQPLKLQLTWSGIWAGTQRQTQCTLELPAPLQPNQQAAPPEPTGEITLTKPVAWNEELFRVEPAGRVVAGPLLETSGEVRLAAKALYHLSAPAAGSLVWLPGQTPEAGAQVAHNQLLLNLSTQQQITDNLAQRKAKLTARARQLRARSLRLDSLLAQQLATRTELEQTRMDLQQVEAELDQLAAFDQSGVLPLKAPLTGRILRWRVQPGAYVEQGAVLADILQQNSLQLHIRLPATAAMEKIQQVRVRTAQGYQRLDVLGGRLLTSEPLPVEGAPYRMLRANLPRNSGLQPGQVVEVLLEGPPQDSLLALPRACLMESFGRYACYVQVTGESYARRSLELGPSLGDSVVVQRGLSAGERVVTGLPSLVRLSAQQTAPAHTH